MSHDSTAFYRSRVVRPIFIATGLFAGWGVSPWGPPAWHDTPSLRLLHHWLPWPVMTAGFAVYVLLLLSGRLDAVACADWIGLAMYTTALVALLVTIRFDRPNNPLALAAVVGMCALHYLAARLATYQLEDA